MPREHAIQLASTNEYSIDRRKVEEKKGGGGRGGEENAGGKFQRNTFYIIRVATDCSHRRNDLLIKICETVLPR